MRHRYLRYSTLYAAFVLAACAGHSVDPPQGPAGSGADPNDPVAKLTDGVAPLANACVFSSSTGKMTVTIANGETGIVTLRTADKAILQNGDDCVDASTGVTALSTNIKKLVVTTTGSPAAATAVLDFSNGLFAMSNDTAGGGLGGTTGVIVDLSGATSKKLAIKTTGSADTVRLGKGDATGSGCGYASLCGGGALELSGDTKADIGIATGAVSDLILSLGDGDDKYYGDGKGSATALGALGIAYATSGSAALHLYGGNGNDTFFGGSDANLVKGEVISGGPGTDVVDYSARTNALNVSVGSGANDGASAATENDDIGLDVERILAGSGNDTLSSFLTSCSTTVVGGGCVTLDGGAGNDWFDQKTAISYGEVLIGGAGTDVVDYSGRTNALTVTMDGTASNDGESGEKDSIGLTVENLYAGTGADSITGNALDNVISGGAGNDSLYGLDGNDTFVMVAWDHNMNASSTNTWLLVADGNDLVVGGNGVDTVDYSSRSEGAFIVATLHDNVTGDLFAADSGKSATNVGPGGVASAETDNLQVENLIGSKKDSNVLRGRPLSSNDLMGGAGADTIIGGALDDYIDGGGAGTDAVSCGGGFDVLSNPGGGTKNACEL
jgi:Ca2+-binding RTX toxin-like protein